MDSYDRRKVGKLIAWGGDHCVYEYGDGEVIKFSLLDFLIGEKGVEKAKRDYELCRKFLGPCVLETRFVAEPRGKRTAKTQPRIVGRPLLKSDLEDESVCTQFLEIERGYRALIDSAGVEVDLLGRHGFITGRSLSNIFVTHDHRLIIFDTTLLEINDVPPLKPVFWLLRALILLRQDPILRTFQAAASH